MSPQAGIEYYHKHYPLYVPTHLQKSDIGGISYAAGFFLVDNDNMDKIEVWIDDYYIHPDTIKWIKYDPFCHAAIIDNFFNGYDFCRVFTNQNILFRYSKLHQNDDNEKLYVERFDVSTFPYKNLDMSNSMFYISENRVFKPLIVKIDDATIEVRIKYNKDIDFFICENLQRVVDCNYWKREYVAPPTSNKLYCSMIVNNRDDAFIDARFYPAILANGLVRVYRYGAREVKYPSTAFLINYPDFAGIWDPYHPDPDKVPKEIFDFIKNYKASGADDVIVRDDKYNEAKIYDKLSRICAGCYNICDIVPTDKEHPNFVICDNTNKLNPTFVEDYDDLKDKAIIRSTVPYQPYRDVVIYDQYPIYNDKYETVEVDGVLYYSFSPDEFDIDKLTLIKFHTDTDSCYENISYYIDKKNFLNLHIKMNRFYRNLLALRSYEIQYEKDKVLVGTTEPTPEEFQDYLWFEYLVNLIPEEFDSKLVTIYKNKESIPEPIREGMYSLDLPVDENDTGKKSYTSLMDTYFKLTSYYKDHLVLHHEPGVDDPNVAELETVQLGSTKENPDILPTVPNEFLLDSDEFVQPPETRDFYYHDKQEYPEIPNSQVNDLYVQIDAKYKEPENMPIGNIEFGNFTPKANFNKLWIEPYLPESANGKPDKDAFDSVSNKFFVAENLTKLDESDRGAYGIDGITGVKENTQVNLVQASDTDVEITDPELFNGLMNAITNQIKVNDIKKPVAGMYALDDEDDSEEEESDELSDIGKELNETILKMPRAEKENIIKHFITDDEEPKNPEKNDWWFHYVSKVEDYILNTITRHIILCKSMFNVVEERKGALAMEDGEFPDFNRSSVFIGNNEGEITDPDSLLIKYYDQHYEDGSLVDWDKERRAAIKYIVSMRDPVDVKEGDLWFKLAPFRFTDVIDDVLASLIIECGTKLPEEVYPDMVLMPDGVTHETTALFDYGMHGDENEVETFQERKTRLVTLDKYNSYTDDDLPTSEDGMVFYDWLDDIYQFVCYSSLDAYVLRIDNHLYGVDIDENEDVTIFAFDDIALHFTNGNRAVKYIAILADLMESGTVKPEELVIFYTRLITGRDIFDPKLHRIYTRTSNVIAGIKTEEDNFSIIYSKNIGRFVMDYRYAKDREQENAYRMIIDLRDRDFAYLKNRMLLFVNGRYIRPCDISEPAAHYVKINNFDEIIATVDIIYSLQDEHLMRVKKAAATNYPYHYKGKVIKDSEYGIMKPISITSETLKGYYDVLLNDYIFNGYLLERLDEIGEDEEMFKDLLNDLLGKFEFITDKYIFNFESPNKIIIPAINSGKPYYNILGRTKTYDSQTSNDLSTDEWSD